MQCNVMLTNTAVEHMLCIQKHRYERYLTHKVVMDDTFTPQDLVKVWDGMERRHTQQSNRRHVSWSIEKDAIGDIKLSWVIPARCKSWWRHQTNWNSAKHNTPTIQAIHTEALKHWDKCHWIQMIVMDDTCTQEDLVKVSNRRELSQTQQSKTCYAWGSTKMNAILYSTLV